MPLHLSWYLENRILLVVNEGESNDDDMFELDRLTIEQLNRSDAAQVHMIIDTSKYKFVPSAKAVTQVEFAKHPRMGWTVLIGSTNAFERFVFVVGANFFKTRSKMLTSIDEALQFLNKIDTSLPPLTGKSLEQAS